MCLEHTVHRAARSRPQRAGWAGFTLIEMMIVVALIALLSAIVLPSYQSSVRKARRADARIALTVVAQRMERLNTEKNSYATATLGPLATDLYKAVTENGHYTLTLSKTATTFTVTATPAGGQALDPCGTYTLTHADTRGASLPVEQCW